MVDNSGGRWEISCHGLLTEVGVFGEAFDTGKEGGLVATWTYIRISEAALNYNIVEGYIH